MVKSSEILFVGVAKNDQRKKTCGCIELKRDFLGFEKWVLYIDCMCKKHKKDHLKDFNRQERIRIENEKPRKKKKIKKDDKE